MRRKLINPFRRWKLPVGLLVWMAAAALLPVSPASGLQFDMGDLDASLDTTLSYGLSYRVGTRDNNIVGLANGGSAYGVNGDDGNLNFGKEITSNAIKGTSELDLKYKNFGVFVRGSAFYDFEYEDGRRSHIDLTDKALDLVGSDARLLDAYFSARFSVMDRPVVFRIGEQVVSWGESTFFQNSINAINPVNVSALLLPGAELKEALLPEGMVYSSIGLTNSITVEGFYLYDWGKTEIEPPGSYFSTNDFAGDGGSRVMLGFGDWSEFGTRLGALGLDKDFMAVGREARGGADDSGQFGVALRFLSSFLGDTEFGLYFMNYHSRVPIISARTGTQGGLGNAVAAATALTLYSTPGSPTAGNAAASIAAGAAKGAQAGASNPAGAATGALTVAGTAGPDAASRGTAARTYILDQYSQTARYLTEYPEDIKLIGASFNTDIGATGIALQSEFSFRFDVPLQVDDLELLFAALTPFSPVNPIFKINQITSGNALGLNQYISGYIKRDVSQAQATATKAFGPTIGADTFILVGELAWTHVYDMPSKRELRLEGPGTYTSGEPRYAATGAPHGGKPAESGDHFADKDSWGYRLVGRLEYNNAIGPVNLIPRLAWQHDVAGNSPGPGGNFLEGRKAVTVGVTGTYLSAWSADLSYTNFFGAGRYNLINDRDFIAANIKYSF
jgi:hypothetical protein